MTNGRALNQKRHYTLTWLPWLLGIAALGLYLGTINPSISFLLDWTSFFGTSPAAARMANWTFEPELIAPVYYAVTYPIRWLPSQLIPVAANLFSAGCAALVILQLARSVALLPHDRTRDQREREDSDNSLLTIPTAWLPPLFACLVCGLQLTFWEHGTNATTEMFDVLLFSYVVRSILEFRVHQKDGQLFRAALVFGAAITNNYAMIGFFPLFLVALVWSKKLNFFNLRFLGRVALCGLAGLLFYLLLPTLGSLKHDQPLTFWELLSANLQREKFLLFFFPKTTILLLSLTTILPVFLFSIRWSSQFGDPSPIGVILTTIIFHLSHIVVLLGCVWMMLDPGFSPRNTGFSFLAFLPFYYLAALSIGYYSGYLLLVTRALPDRMRRPTPLATWVQRGTAAGMLLLLLAAAAALLHRNLPQIRLAHRSLQPQFTAALTQNLPKDGIVISDEPRRLWLVQEWLARHGRSQDFTILCSQWLLAPEYHQYLKRRYPNWVRPAMTSEKEPVPQQSLLDMMEKLGTNTTITYLHPSFGYYFESFASQPNGLTYQLIPHPKTSLVPPPPAAAVIARNQNFWSNVTETITKTLLPITSPPPPARQPAFPENLYRKIGLKPEPNSQALTLGAFYSRALVNWAVELQKAGDYDSAAAHLKFAHQLNPKNVVADINLAFNEKYRSGEPLGLELDRPLDEFFGESRSWEQVLSLHGPYDAPALSFAQGYVFVQGNLIRQAAQSFDRTRLQATNDVSSRLWLGQLNLNQNFPDRTLEMIGEIRQILARVPELTTNLTDLFTLEAAAYLAKNQDAIATAIIETNLASHPDDFNLLASACKAYADNGRYTNALALTERMLKLAPENTACWINRGCFLMEVPAYDRAIESFSQVLILETNNYRAVLYRAIAQLRAEKFDEAIKDYETVQRQYPREFTVDYGLGEIAYRRHDTNAAIRYYESYLTNAPPKTAEAKLIGERLNELKGVKPAPPQ